MLELEEKQLLKSKMIVNLVNSLKFALTRDPDPLSIASTRELILDLEILASMPSREKEVKSDKQSNSSTDN